MSAGTSSESDPILVSYHDSIVRSSNLKTLDPSNWLDDNIITFAFEYIQYDSKFLPNKENFFAFVSPPVVQLLKMTDDSFAEQLLQSMDFSEKKFLILPINNNKQVTVFGGSHWSLLILSIQEKILYHFDSMSSANDRTAKEIQGKLKVFFHENIQLINARCPQQRNGFDCGLYVIVIVEEFCRFVQEYFTGNGGEKENFGRFMDEIQRTVTSDYINQRRVDFKSLIQSMSMEKKK